MIPHAVTAAQNNYHRDTDVVLLLIHHITADEVWMDAGTTKNPRCIPVHDMRNSLPVPLNRNLLAFHAITGCDSTSVPRTWKNWHLENIHDSFSANGVNSFAERGGTDLNDEEKEHVINIYSPTSNASSVDALRVEMFHRVDDPENLPPTQS